MSKIKCLAVSLYEYDFLTHSVQCYLNVEGSHKHLDCLSVLFNGRCWSVLFTTFINDLDRNTKYDISRFVDTTKLKVGGYWLIKDTNYVLAKQSGQLTLRLLKPKDWYSHWPNTEAWHGVFSYNFGKRVPRSPVLQFASKPHIHVHFLGLLSKSRDLVGMCPTSL